MKSNLPSGLLAAAFLMTLMASSPAQSITSSVLTDQSTMPGSALDFSFFGNPAYFPGDTYYTHGTATQPVVLTDFTQSQGSTGEYINGGVAGNSTIYSPTGTSVLTGELFGPDARNGNNLHYVTDAVTYTLLSVPTFNYANFYVYVMFDNGPQADSQITLTLTNSGGTVITEQAQAVAPGSVSTTAADFVAFQVMGAASGDKLEVGDVGSTSGAYGQLGGVSFEEAPEPATWAMLFGGLGLLAFASLVRRTLRA